MKTQSDTRFSVLIKYPPLIFIAIGGFLLVTLRQYQLLIDQFQFYILGLNSRHTMQKMILATIGQGFPCLMSLSSLPCSSIY